MCTAIVYNLRAPAYTYINKVIRPYKRSPPVGSLSTICYSLGENPNAFPNTSIQDSPTMHNILSVNARVTLLAIHLKLKVAMVQDTLHQFCGCP